MIENFSSRIMQRWGIGYEEMKQIKPDIVYVSMAGFGHTGRHHWYGTMGPAAQALSVPQPPVTGVRGGGRSPIPADSGNRRLELSDCPSAPLGSVAAMDRGAKIC